MHLGGVTANPTGEWTVRQARRPETASNEAVKSDPRSRIRNLMTCWRPDTRSDPAAAQQGGVGHLSPRWAWCASFHIRRRTGPAGSLPQAGSLAVPRLGREHHRRRPSGQRHCSRWASLRPGTESGAPLRAEARKGGETVRRQHRSGDCCDGPASPVMQGGPGGLIAVCLDQALGELVHVARLGQAPLGELVAQLGLGQALVALAGLVILDQALGELVRRCPSWAGPARRAGRSARPWSRPS